MSTKEVKTRQNFSEFAKERWGNLDASTYNARLEAWNAALSSVELPGGRFEVGDRAQRLEAGETYISGQVIFMPDGLELPAKTHIELRVMHGDVYRPLPKTVDLTVIEKVDAVEKAMAALSEDSRISVVRELTGLLANGKTIDKLCQQYGVETTRSV